MALTLVTPAAAIVSLAEAKSHVRAHDYTDDDDYLTALVATAQDNIGGVHGWLGRALGSSVWLLKVDAFPCDALRLPMPPLISVGAVTYVDVDGATQTLTGIRSFGVGSSAEAGYILPAYDAEWPATRAAPEAVSVTFTAGYASPPPAIKHAILLMVGHLYRNREAVGAKLETLPMGVDALLMPYRHWPS